MKHRVISEREKFYRRRSHTAACLRRLLKAKACCRLTQRAFLHPKYLFYFFPNSCLVPIGHLKNRQEVSINTIHFLRTDNNITEIAYS